MSTHPVTNQNDKARKIIQILYDHSIPSKRPQFIVLCDDGTVWRQLKREIERAEDYGPHQIIESSYELVWERATEFDDILHCIA